MTSPRWTPAKLVLTALSAAQALLLAMSLSDAETTQWFFLETTYYLHAVALLCWLGVSIHDARDLRWASAAGWVRENWPGLVLSISVTTIAALAVEPALRVLSDEANLVGTSKNLFTSKTPTFTVSGKSYYGSYWDIDVAIDQRPTLFPFLVSLVHAVCGYAYDNVYSFNLLVLGGFVLVSYRLAKTAAGETFGVVAALCVAAHPSTLISARSGGFDLLAAFLALLALKSLFAVLRDASPGKLAIAWMSLCLFAGVRYEGALFLAPIAVLLIVFKSVTLRRLAPYAFVYALSPAFLAPRLWQALLRGSVPAQEAGTAAFSAQYLVHNAFEYFEPLLHPFAPSPAHSPLLIALGLGGSMIWSWWLAGRVRANDWGAATTRFAVLAGAWILLQAAIVFSYAWGRAQYPSAARLFLPIDTFFSFAAAWLLTCSLARWPGFVPTLLALAVFVGAVPVAAQHRMMNRLTQSRESARTWKFFEGLGEKNILIVTDRPSHFTIMGYGAMSFDEARRDRHLFTAHARRLFQDVYVIQQLRLSTNQPLPGYDLWPEQTLVSVLEFQNDADVLVRVGRLARSAAE